MIREGFKRLFDWAAHDCEVVGEAADGMEALAQIDALQPDIAIMDINIPILNGLKVIQRSRVNHPDTAFIIVSGYDDFSYCREALRLQITDYILKPVDYEEFGDCIDNLKITLFQRRAAAAPEQQDERPITGLTRYLQAHLAEDISLNLLAEEFHLSAPYISQLFKTRSASTSSPISPTSAWSRPASCWCPPRCPSPRCRSSAATATTGCSPRPSRRPRASPPPNTAGTSWKTAHDRQRAASRCGAALLCAF